MCGIVGYIGNEQAAPILLDGLAKLEYRGYDSAGIAVYDGKEISVSKAVGRLEILNELTHGGETMPGHIGIGHTRWATHGVPSNENSHPHFNKDSSIVVVHNGIIENYQELKNRLVKKGYEFVSQTDTEVVAHMLDYYYTGDPLETIVRVMEHVEGSYALGIMFKKHPGEVYAVRKDSPLIVGHCKSGNIIASDVPAVLKYTRDVYFIQNKEIVKLTEDDIKFYNIDLDELEKESVRINWDVAAAEKGGFKHFMMKEINEQPRAVRDTIMPRIRDGRIVIDELGMTDEDIRNISRILIVGCGSASYAGQTARYVFEGLSRIPTDVDLGSEFRYRNPIFDKNSLAIIVSQSGETADSLEALRELNDNGVRTLGIVNVVGSSIAREAGSVLYTNAGPEISVATTKAYSAQLSAFYLLAVKFAHARGKINDEELSEYVCDLENLPDQIEMTLGCQNKMQRFANRWLAAREVFFIGRGIDYSIAMEGSLKLKEIAYVHSEAYAAGELKHGTIALIEEGTLVTAILTQEDLYKKTMSNVVECKTRGAFIMAVTNDGNTEIRKNADYVVYVPKTNKYFTNSLAIIPLQIFAYYISIGKGCDVDKPRNLAKSVTVE